MEGLGFTSGYKVPPPRKGRRAYNPGSISSSAPNGDLDSANFAEISAPPGSTTRVGILSSPIKMINEAPFPPRSRKTGGWANEVSSKNGKEKSPLTLDVPQKIGSDDDIPLIPDLDDLQDEDVSAQVARAPSVVGNKLASFVELDSDLMKQSALSTLDDINLTAISSRLYVEEDVQEEDSTWTWELLFTEVSSDLRTEWENSNNDSDQVVS